MPRLDKLINNCDATCPTFFCHDRLSLLRQGLPPEQHCGAPCWLGGTGPNDTEKGRVISLSGDLCPDRHIVHSLLVLDSLHLRLHKSFSGLIIF